MILLIGTNPRDEAPVLNARIRKAWANGAKIAVIGEAADLTYDYVHIGTDRAALAALAAMDHSDKHGICGVTIVGQGALREADGAAVLGTIMNMTAAANSKLMILHTAASRVGAMDVGAVTEGGLNAAIDGADVIYNLGADEVDIDAGAFVIYQGSHGDRGAHRADIILPGAAYTEENGLFVNTEGRPQLAMRAGFAPGEAKENWAILRALSAELGSALPYDSLAQLRQALVAAHPHLAQIDQVAENEWKAEPADKMGDATFKNAISDFYLTNPIARASSVMAELSANAKARAETKVAAE
jgi:NADH-quinone oxidoreductase subunit G